MAQRAATAISSADRAQSNSGKPASARKTRLMQVDGTITVRGAKLRIFVTDVPEKTKCAVNMRMMQAMYFKEFIRSKTLM